MADPAPRMPIRRFDVFADYNRVKNEAAGMPEPRAKGDAIWLAKVVAGRRFGSAAAASTAPRDERHAPDGGPESASEGFKSAGGVPQTDRTFDEEIVERMGAPFYHQVFHPAIAQAFHEGKRYEEIRDSIRAAWKKVPTTKEVSS
jgi:hypothetical protein